MLFRVIYSTGVLTAIALISACSGDQAQKRHEANQYLRTAIGPSGAAMSVAAREPCDNYSELRQPFFGDTHVHTSYSFDARAQDTRATPEDAYRFAKGEALLIQPFDENGVGQRKIQIDRPLDFTSVTDHAEFLGEVKICYTPGMQGYSSWPCMLHRNFAVIGMQAFSMKTAIYKQRFGFCDSEQGDGAYCELEALDRWKSIQAAAEQAYDRTPECSFTSFVGYEWTGLTNPNAANLHRNVIFENEHVPTKAVSWVDTPSVEQLWDYLEQDCVANTPGCNAVTIPHNSNISAGLMFQNPAVTAEEIPELPVSVEQAQRRARWEPLIELTQHKGESECDSRQALWAGDEFCNEEKFVYDTFGGKPTGVNEWIPDWLRGAAGDLVPPTELPTANNFVRWALKEGLRQQAEIGVNSLKFGLSAATDTHIAAPGLTQEKGHPGHGGAGRGAKEAIVGLPDELENGPGGLTVLWGEQNTRESLFAAMQRKEAYATSGTRPLLRFFGGAGLDKDLCGNVAMVASAYAQGVPMGSDLEPADQPPRFLVAVSQDSGTAEYPGAPLQRVQIVKGWYKDGEVREQVLDVAGGDNGASVDLNTCKRIGEGHAQLCTVWEDPDFDPDATAFYYARAFENPSCRWSQYQCNDAGVDCSDPSTISEGFEACCAAEHQRTVQERAWSSPIWYTPA